MINPSNIPYLTHTWNPGGFGCSHGCPTCWARKIPARMGRSCPCSDCRNFKVHLHEERLRPETTRPARRPRVIGVQFTGELFDPQRPYRDIHAVLDAARPLTGTDIMVFLTQRPDIASDAIREWMDARQRAVLPSNWWFGATVKNPAGLRFAMEHLTQIPSPNLWLSCEPLEATLDFADYLTLYPRIRLVVLGADNTPGRPEVLGFIRDAARQVREAQTVDRAFMPDLYVKQIWLWRCPNCQRYSEGVPDGRCVCGTATTEYRRALVKHLVDLPADLAVQDLPWDLSAAKTKTTTEDTETTETKGGLF